MPITLNVSLAERQYPIYIGEKLLHAAEHFAGHGTRALVVSNPVVAPLYAEPLMNTLAKAGVRAELLIIPDGESHKTWTTLNLIFDRLLSEKYDRKSLLIALGGGVVGDMVGFAAASYQRGIPFLQVPTTLLAQVDSSVGGKTAINHPLGKNMIGAFYQPQAVVIDTDTLSTLPEREFLAGLAEVVKYGIALDAAFFAWLEDNIDALRARDQRALAYAIQRSCEIKAAVVAADERETAKEGGRALLNFGHTFGHAIEACLGYGVWLHGEAVGCGMALATRLCRQTGELAATDASRIDNLLLQAGLQTALPPGISAAALVDHMGRDKKNENGLIRLILVTQLGASRVDGRHTAVEIERFLRQQGAT